MVGTVSRDGGGGLAGQFRAELASAAAFVKERPAFAKFEPSPDAPVLELNGRARWQVRGRGCECEPCFAQELGARMRRN